MIHLILCLGVLANGCEAPKLVHEFEVMADCERALKTMKLTGIKSDAGVLAICVTDYEDGHK